MGSEGFKEKVLELMGNEQDLLLIKGQLVRPELRQKKDGSGQYIVFEIRVVKDGGGSKYDLQFNQYSIIVLSSDVQEMGPVIKQFKDSEVLAVVRPNARVRKGQNGGKFNNIDLYLDAIFLVEQLKKESQQVIAL